MLSLAALAAWAPSALEFPQPVVVDSPYFFSPDPCDGCWYGDWNGRHGWHRGGGEPWRRDHREGDHRGGNQRDRGRAHPGH